MEDGYKMKLTKQERDDYVLLKYKVETNKQLAINTGWSETTIKSSLSRQGLSRKGKTSRTKEIEEYIKNNDKDDTILAQELGCKIDRVRDVRKSLGMYKSPSDKAFDSIVKHLPTFTLRREDYVTNKVSMKVVCKQCNHTTYPKPNDITTFGHTCAPCAVLAKKIKKEKLHSKLKFERKLLIKLAMQAKYKPNRLEKVHSHYGKVFNIKMNTFNLIRLECKTCGYTRGTKYHAQNSSRLGTCIRCNISVMSKELEFKQQCDKHGYTLISEYGKVVKVLCPQGHTRTAGPYNIQKYGCRECTKEGKYYVYLMNLEEGIYKVGISNDPDRRRDEVARSGNIPHLVLTKTWEFSGRSGAAEVEGKVLANFGKVFGSSKIFDGSTEFIYGSFGQLSAYISSLI